ncbi:MAG: helix-turn-helix transcriptional regulator [Kiritimatiellae bacterium]|nr:helix-turn-helix transcriptional regulator [Kiritimatiellia bacterium]
MNWQRKCWSMALGSRPRITQISMGTHGYLPVQWWRIYAWTIHLYRYEGRIVVDGESFPLRLGHMGINSPGVFTEYHFPTRDCSHFYAHFLMEPAASDGVRVELPVMFDWGSRYEEVCAATERILRMHARNRLRAEILLWDLLWELADSFSVTRGTDPRLNPAVRKVMEWVEQRNFAESLRAGDLAGEVGYSATHLNRLFRVAVGKPLKRYIMDRRLEKAGHLLSQTTIPIKSVARQCGFRDAQIFNKSIRKRYGLAPSEMRRRARAVGAGPSR